MTSIRTVFVFSGQGSQYRGMGRALYECDPAFRRYLQRLDALARDHGAGNVLDAILCEGESIAFEHTLVTHPAIFMLEYALALRLIEGGIVPDVVFGASLGTFAAAAVAGCMDENTAMAAVVAQAQAFERYCAPGGMISILDAPSLYDEHPFLHRNSELAAVNFSTHFSVAAPTAALDLIEEELKRRNIVHQRLAVSFAFHSRWIDAAREPYLNSIHGLPLYRSTLPIARSDTPSKTTFVTTHEDLWHVARRPIQFCDAVNFLEREGACRYIDVGPSGTMATFLKYALPRGSSSTMHPIITPYRRDERNLAAVLAMHSHGISDTKSFEAA
jgi:bacillaene synthase trans-acting acyltransferase